MSLAKGKERTLSPKIRRGVTSKNSTNVPNNKCLIRRQSLKCPLLPSIQGTLTKPSEKPLLKARLTRISNPSSEKAKKNSLQPPKIVSRSNKSSSMQKFTSTEGHASSSKIPLRRVSIFNQSASTRSLSSIKPEVLSPSSNLVSPLETTGINSHKTINSNSLKKPGANNAKNSNAQILKQRKTSEKEKRKAEYKQCSNIIVEAAKILEDDLGLMDLLKQSSGATGTSSVVNTTTATAVQPLQMDETSIIPKETIAKIGGSENQTIVESSDKSETSNPVESSLNSKNVDKQTAQRKDFHTYIVLFFRSVIIPYLKNHFLSVSSSNNQVQFPNINI